MHVNAQLYPSIVPSKNALNSSKLINFHFSTRQNCLSVQHRHPACPDAGRERSEASEGSLLSRIALPTGQNLTRKLRKEIAEFVRLNFDAVNHSRGR